MIVHMVLFKMKRGVPAAEIGRVLDAVGALKRQLPGILSYSWGPYASPEGLNRGYTHGFCMTFTDARSRDDYLVHPKHEAVKTLVLAVLDGGVDGVVAFDYESR